MNIYANFDYQGGLENSRKLLARAIDAFNLDEGIVCEKTGEELVKEIELGEHGKPYIPGWQHFSVSHSGNAWAVLIHDEECGLDIQYVREIKHENIADRFFAKEDAEAIANGDSDTFFRVWTRREAAIKAIGATVASEIPSVLEDIVELNNEIYFLQDVELLGANELPFGAMCTKGIPTTIHYYSL